MKRALFLIAAFALVSSGAVVNQAKASDDTKTKSTFYGSKASSNSNNPCKGATTRVCGIIETRAQQISVGVTTVTQTTTDPKGNILSTTMRITDKTPEQIREEVIRKALSKGAVAIPHIIDRND
ncbi:hypothetical protein [Bacteroides sp. GM023]|uniref:hypothetical protein n=1 Tax=Bacteroides sp. GM023 TaxID=2723058 RepID=UPI00168A89C4|nr:hypothetical protein [Bacteroides sp. GM023]MBD3588794.1 hypothetical protein [Bacteroides sp. GM023]